MLRRKSYRGDTVYNERPHEPYYRVDSKGEVVEAGGDDDEPGKVFVVKGAHEPLVSPRLFDKAQVRLALVSRSRSRNRMKYALSGILRCNRCGQAMMACQRQKGGATLYKCSSNANKGRGSCEYFTIRETDILPIIGRLLTEEVTNVKTMLSTPPAELRAPNKKRADRREQAQKDRDALAKSIADATKNLMFINDPRNRKDCDTRLSEMRDDLERLDEELAVEPVAAGLSRADLDALNRWWDEFQSKAVSVPFSGELPPEAVFWQDPDSEERALMIDAAVVNDLLHQLGARVELEWKTETYTTASGSTRRRHTPVRGRFRLGQRSGKLVWKGGKDGEGFRVASGTPGNKCSWTSCRRRGR
jgi:hypothetical protein